MDILALIISILTFLLSVRINWRKEKIERLKSRPVFYINSTYENRTERQIKIGIISHKNEFLRNVKITWSGDEKVSLKYNKIPEINGNLWSFNIIVDFSETDETKDVRGRINIIGKTVYEKQVEYYKDIIITSKYYPFVDEYNQELIGISSTEMIEK